jgi:hypothetical protein
MDKNIYRLLKTALEHGIHSIDCETNKLTLEVIYGPNNEIAEQCCCWMSETQELIDKEDLKILEYEVNADCNFCKHPRDRHSTSGVCSRDCCNCFKYV